MDSASSSIDSFGVTPTSFAATPDSSGPSDTESASAKTLLAEPALSLGELDAQITELAGHLNAANYRWLCLIAELDRRNGVADDGATRYRAPCREVGKSVPAG